MTKHCLLILAICGLLSACVEPPSKEGFVTRDSMYFLDIDSLIRSNVIEQNGRKLKKQVGLSGSSEQQYFIADSSLLQNDLEIFKDLPLNAPTLEELYEISLEGPETTYKRKDSGGPQRMQVSRSKDLLRIMQISASHKETNLFFDSNKKYQIQLDSKQRISKYEFSGYQKILFMDTVYFKIVGEFEP